MADRYKCIQGHFTDKEHNGKSCPYDNMSTKELSKLATQEIVTNEKTQEVVYVTPKTIEKYRQMSSKERKQSIKNITKRLEEHLNKIRDPEAFAKEWKDMSVRRQNGLVSYWAKEVKNLRNQIKALEIVENERK